MLTFQYYKCVITFGPFPSHADLICWYHENAYRVGVETTTTFSKTCEFSLKICIMLSHKLSGTNSHEQ